MHIWRDMLKICQAKEGLKAEDLMDFWDDSMTDTA